MARVITRVIRSERRRAASVEIKEELKATWARLITPRIEGYYQNIVNEWSAENRPIIVSIVVDTADGFQVFTRPSGKPGEDIWNWITNGTPPHKIPKSPKPPGTALRFQWDGPGSYRPKTGLSGQYRGPGTSSGPIRYFKQIDHPGNKPRNFEQHIARWYKQTKRYPRGAKNAIERGIYRGRRA